MNTSREDIPVIELMNWSPEDLAIDIATRGYRITPAANLEALGEPVAWAIDHQDRIVFIDADLDWQAFRQAVNEAYNDVHDHQPKGLPRDRQAAEPDLSPWAVDPTPEPGPDEWIERRYELHRVAYARFIEATKGYDRNTARLAALVWFSSLSQDEQAGFTEMQEAEAFQHVGPGGQFMGIDHHSVHVTIPPVVRQLMDRNAAKARKAQPGNMLAGTQLGAAFWGFAMLDPDAIAGAVIDAEMLIEEPTAGPGGVR